MFFNFVSDALILDTKRNLLFFRRPSSEVTFHFFGNSQDGDKIREALNRLVQRRRLNEITLESTHFTFQQKPSLRLQVVKVKGAVNAVNKENVLFIEPIFLP